MPVLTKVKLTGYEQPEGTFYTCVFESYVVKVERLQGKIVTTFSNGCVLVQHKVEPVPLERPAIEARA